MNTEKELESIIKKGKRLKAERGRDMNFTEKHIEEMMSSVDALLFMEVYWV